MFTRDFLRTLTGIFLLQFIFVSYANAKITTYTPISIDASIVIFVPFVPSKPKSKGILKKTGQLKSYNADGIEVIDGSIKDDGYYQVGLIPRYSRYKDVVTDYATGLRWQDNTEVRRVTKTWEDAKKYCSELKLNAVGWRLPTIQELQTIVIYGIYNPSIDTKVFLNYYGSSFWSNTIGVGGNYAWRVNFNDGDTDFRTISDILHIRCVR